MEMKTSAAKLTSTEPITRIALALLVAGGAASAMGVGLTIFSCNYLRRGALSHSVLGEPSALGIGLVAAVVADPWICEK